MNAPTLDAREALASRFTLLALSLGHGCADVCSGALWALPAFLVVGRHYSYQAVGLFGLAASLATAVVQPLAGAHGDRGRGRWLLPSGLVLAALGIAAVGLTTRYPMTLAAAMVCSVGVAAYHPEGARWARYASSRRVTADMGIFSVGGGLGYAVGPLLVAAVLAPLGLAGTPVIALVPLAAAAVVVVAVRRFRRLGRHEHLRKLAATARPEWRPFACLLALSGLASGVTSGLIVYVPLFLIHAREVSAAASNVMTSILLAAGAAGTLIGGVAAQRLGRRVVLVAPQLALSPLIGLLPSLGYAAMVPFTVLIGICVNANISLALVLAQEYLPSRMGLASGLTIGMCSGVGGLIVAALGLLGDSAGPASVLYALAALPLAVAVLAVLLPKPSAAPAGTVWGWSKKERGAR